MSPEMTWLSASVALFGACIFLQAIVANLNFKPAELLGARDGFDPNTNKFLGRTKRIQMNMIEAMVMFVPLVLIIEVTERNSETTALACLAFFAARVLYVPAYLFAIPFIRSVVWFIGLVATVALFLRVLPFS